MTFRWVCPRTLGIDELVRVAFVLKDFGQPGVGDDSIAAAFGWRLGAVIVLGVSRSAGDNREERSQLVARHHSRYRRP